MAQGGEGHQPPEISLNQRQARAVEDADDREGNQIRSRRTRLHREESDVKAKHGVEAQLAGHDHGQGHRRLIECVRKPAVQREDRNLDGEGE